MNDPGIASSNGHQPAPEPVAPIVVRAATSEADYREAAVLARPQWRGFSFTIESPSEVSPEWLDEQCGPPTGCVLMALLRGQTLGCVGLQWAGTRTGHIHRLYFPPGDWRYAVEERLLRELVERATAWGYGRLRVCTWRAESSSRSLHRSFGFRSVQASGANAVKWAVVQELALGGPTREASALAA